MARASSASEIGAILAATTRPCPSAPCSLPKHLQCRLITEAVDAVLATSPEVSPTEISKWCSAMPLARYLIGKPELTIVIGMPAWRSALDRLGMSPQENRYALAGTTGHS